MPLISPPPPRNIACRLARRRRQLSRPLESRKHRGHDAVAISSRALATLAPHAAVSAQPFGSTSACQALQADRCCVAPP